MIDAPELTELLTHIEELGWISVSRLQAWRSRYRGAGRGCCVLQEIVNRGLAECTIDKPLAGGRPVRQFRLTQAGYEMLRAARAPVNPTEATVRRLAALLHQTAAKKHPDVLVANVYFTDVARRLVAEGVCFADSMEAKPC